MTTPRPTIHTTRWHIRLEAYRHPKFGETRRDVLRWAVREYTPTLTRPEQVHPTYFKNLIAAHVYARRACTRRYGTRGTQ